ncbi:ABC transporter ATP-binding protein [Olivibacter sp. XZL3]|uniref:ABC transporter ATP-binding protein n=1 Tax=Olivibacter sp. XZL3 TaxID=1735116 RepID=UPI001066603D|nr:ABC transporter ATP-binding protein [Olivibacter sp. XZL3]
MIKIQEVSKSFGDRKAVDQLSLEIRAEENLILLGASGCGKTTMLKMINRLLTPDTGQIFINNKNIWDQSAVDLRRNMGYVLQNTGLFPHYSVAQNIAIVPHLLKWDKKRIEKRIDELLEKLHLSTRYRSMYPHELSGGQQQRVGLARALAAEPSILLMDEPFGALDNVTRAKIQEEFIALDELKRKTIIMVTHDVQEAFELGDQICLMDKGKVVQTGAPEDLLFRPSSPLVTDFLNEQRLQLEFKVIQLQALWKWLPPGSGPATTAALPSKTTLWRALAYFKYRGAEALQILDRERNELKAVQFEQLMAAFYQYKKNIVA